MDIPASQAGTVRELKVSVGDTVSEGHLILLLEGGSDNDNAAPDNAKPAVGQVAEIAPARDADGADSAVELVTVPDIGVFCEVDVIEVLVRGGDNVAVDDPLITLESDKASMDIPSPTAGTIREVLIAVGDKAPPFKLTDHFRREISLEAFAGKQNVMLLFYPLDFTPT